MVIKCSGGWGWESVREVEGSRTAENREKEREVEKTKVKVVLSLSELKEKQ